MKPESRFNESVNRGDEVVTTPQMAELMREDCLDLARSQTIGDSFWEQQDRAKDAEYSRADWSRCGKSGHRDVDAHWRCATYSSPDPKPAAQPGEEADSKTA